MFSKPQRVFLLKHSLCTHNLIQEIQLACKARSPSIILRQCRLSLEPLLTVSAYISGPSSEWPSILHRAQSPLPSFQISLAIPSVPSLFLLVQNTASSLVEIKESRDSQCDHLQSSLLVFLPCHNVFWVTTPGVPRLTICSI